jgi:hypothetical protein
VLAQRYAARVTPEAVTNEPGWNDVG